VAVAISASSHGRHDRELIARLHGRVEPADEADVLVVEVNRHEGVRSAVFVAEARGEGGEATHDVVQCF
jgi:hypothetical protein